jgi:hypothetical protein
VGRAIACAGSSRLHDRRPYALRHRRWCGTCECSPERQSPPKLSPCDGSADSVLARRTKRTRKQTTTPTETSRGGGPSLRGPAHSRYGTCRGVFRSSSSMPPPFHLGRRANHAPASSWRQSASRLPMRALPQGRYAAPCLYAAPTCPGLGGFGFVIFASSLRGPRASWPRPTSTAGRAAKGGAYTDRRARAGSGGAGGFADR